MTNNEPDLEIVDRHPATKIVADALGRVKVDEDHGEFRPLTLTWAEDYAFHRSVIVGRIESPRWNGLVEVTRGDDLTTEQLDQVRRWTAGALIGMVGQFETLAANAERVAMDLLGQVTTG